MMCEIRESEKERNGKMNRIRFKKLRSVSFPFREGGGLLMWNNILGPNELIGGPFTLPLKMNHRR